MILTVIGTDREGNPIDTLTNPDTIKELTDFLTEVYQPQNEKSANNIKTA